MNLIDIIMGLNNKQVLRVTTAKDGRNLAGVSGLIKKKIGKRMRTVADGDDVLVWLED